METQSNIVKTIGAVKAKLRDLKRRKFRLEEHYKATYGPIIEPLERIAGTKGEEGPAKKSKVEEEEETIEPEDDDLYAYDDDVWKPTVAASPNLTPRYPESDRFITRDRTYGMHMDEDTGVRMMGNKPIDWDGKILEVGRRKYPYTAGLMELITSNAPNSDVYTADDLEKYYEILGITLAYRVGYVPTGKVKGSGGYKYTVLIKPQLQHIKSYSGSGHRRRIECGAPFQVASSVGGEDPNLLCDRLRLLVASKQAGHTGHATEIKAILAELRRRGYIQ